MTDNQIEFIGKNNRVLSCREIARKTGLNYNAVRDYCGKIGVSFSRYKNNGCVKKFENIVDKNAAYLLGFLWADGFINYSAGRPSGIGVELLRKDATDIEPLFQKLFKKYGKYARTRGHRQPVITFVVCDVKLARFFIKKYQFDKKSMRFPDISEFIPEDLHVYFLRGYFDGDGYIDVSRTAISATIGNDWTLFEATCKRYGVVTNKVRKYISPVTGHKFSEIRMNKASASLFLRFIYGSYPVDKIGLVRKYQKFATYYL